jgi:exopolysaccharide biosynthesis polyprenyl glycosylphosphotransferase
LELATRPDPLSDSEPAFDQPGPERGCSYASRGKRVLDVVLAVLVIAATWPLWLLIAIAIKGESTGPVFFVQDRVGQRGRHFRFYKFRSMHEDAEERRLQLLSLNEAGGPVFKIRSDPRVTRVGRLLRRTSLDELPQLVNVLRGEMSIVGPRPPRPEEVASYRPSDMARLTVKPGLTCWWQIRGRSNVDFETWMQYDHEYISNVSFLTDVRILMGTVGAVISGRGAY